MFLDNYQFFFLLNNISLDQFLKGLSSTKYKKGWKGSDCIGYQVVRFPLEISSIHIFAHRKELPKGLNRLAQVAQSLHLPLKYKLDTLFYIYAYQCHSHCKQVNPPVSLICSQHKITCRKGIANASSYQNDVIQKTRESVSKLLHLST